MILLARGGLKARKKIKHKIEKVWSRIVKPRNTIDIGNFETILKSYQLIRSDSLVS